jgi:hypothetical protein
MGDSTMAIQKRFIMVVTASNLRGQPMKKAEIEITESQMSNQDFIQSLLDQLGSLTDTELTYEFQEKPLKYFNAHVNVIEYGNKHKVLNTLRFIVQAYTGGEAQSHVYTEMEKILSKRNQEIHHVAYSVVDPDLANDVLQQNISTLFDETDYLI